MPIRRLSDAHGINLERYSMRTRHLQDIRQRRRGKVSGLARPPFCLRGVVPDHIHGIGAAVIVLIATT
jgi:hypothetical protein